MILIFIFFINSLFGSEELVELTENFFNIEFPGNDGGYDVFSSRDSEASFELQWHFANLAERDSYLCTLYSKSGDVSFLSDKGELLQGLLTQNAPGRRGNPIPLYDLRNFIQSAIEVFPETSEKVIRFPLSIIAFPGQFLSPGKYSLFLDVALYTTGGKLIHFQTIQLCINVTAMQKIRLVSSESGYKAISSIDFGELTSPASRTFYIQVLSNVSYKVTAKSQNGGVLLMSPNWRKNHYGCSAIDYDCKSKKGCFSLSKTPQEICFGDNNFDYRGGAQSITITVYPNPRYHWEGVYQDEILLSIRPIY